MSRMLNQIDYENAMIAWRLPPRKAINRNDAHQVNSSEPPPLVQIPNVNNQQGHMHTPIRTEGIHVQQRALNINLAAHESHGPICPYYQQLHASDVVPNRPKRYSNVKVYKRKVPINGMAYHSRQLGLKVPPKKTLGIKGMVIHNQTREVIHNVYKFMKDEAQNGTKIPIGNFRERVLAATGISKCTYSKITSKEFVGGNMVEQVPPRHMSSQSNIGITIDETANQIGASNEHNSMYQPKINRNASTRDGIYNLEELVPASVLVTLEIEAIDIISAGSATDLDLGEFVATNIQKVLQSNIFQEVKIRNISIFLYIHYLIRFINTPMRSVKRNHIVCEKSVEVNNHILDNFSIFGPNGRVRPTHMKDKSLCYIIILAALGIDYEVNLANLAKDCKIGVKKALEISKILAFNSTPKNKTVVTLKLPLPASGLFAAKRKEK